MRAALLGLAVAFALAAQDPLDLARLKDFRALRSSSDNPDLTSNDDSLRPIPGETVTLADLEGPGVVTHIWLTIAANEYGWPRLLRLRVYYDHSPTPSVDAPVGDFFGAGHGYERPLNSLMVVDGRRGARAIRYWPMPFRRSCRITITNEGRRRVANLYYHVDWEKVQTLPPSTGYFHAWYRQELPAQAGKPYKSSTCRAGVTTWARCSACQAEAGMVRGGRRSFYVDGEKQAGIQGTGTEDYFNDAWGLRVSEGPYCGRAGGRGYGPGRPPDRLPLAPADPDPLPAQPALRFRTRGMDLQRRRQRCESAFGERPDLFSPRSRSGTRTGSPADCPSRLTARRACRTATHGRSRWKR